MNPAERKSLLDSYGSAHSRLIKTLKPLPEAVWQYEPGSGEWSIHEVLLHLTDSEANLYVRARRIIAEPGSKVLAFDHDLWAKRLSYQKQNAEASLELFKYLRQLTYDLLKDLPENIWQNTVEHSQFGIMTLDQWLERADKHANDHIKQIQDNFNAWSRRTSTVKKA